MRRNAHTMRIIARRVRSDRKVHTLASEQGGRQGRENRPECPEYIFTLSSQSVIQSTSEFPHKEKAGRDLPVTNLITALSPRNEPRESEGLGGIQELDV